VRPADKGDVVSTSTLPEGADIARGTSSHKRVLPSMSVNRKATTPWATPASGDDNGVPPFRRPASSVIDAARSVAGV
jgi:hypothetical protein